MNRILNQAEDWSKEHESLLICFGIFVGENSKSKPLCSLSEMTVKMDVVNAALENASGISVDLEEAMQLKKMAENTQNWYARALAVAPKRSKRNARGKKRINRDKHELKELMSLVEEAANLPGIDIKDDLERLQMQLNDVQSWRLQAQCELRSIAAALVALRKERMSYYGSPESFLQSKLETCEEMSLEAEGPDSHSQVKVMKSSDCMNVHRMVGNLVKSVQSIGISTEEEKIIELLDKVSKWCLQAAVMIASPEKVFEKRYLKELDNLITEGDKFLEVNKGDHCTEAGQLDDVSLITDLRSGWLGLVSDDKIRLKMCLERRNEFIAWCEKTEAVLSVSDKKIALETLIELASQSSCYPKSKLFPFRLQFLFSKNISFVFHWYLCGIFV